MARCSGFEAQEAQRAIVLAGAPRRLRGTWYFVDALHAGVPARSTAMRTWMSRAMEALIALLA